MSEFVYGTSPLPGTKSDRVGMPAGLSADQYWAAADANGMLQAFQDLKAALLTGTWHGLTAQSSPPTPPPLGQVKLFIRASDLNLCAVLSDGTVVSTSNIAPDPETLAVTANGATTARTLSDWFSDRTSVKAFGAVGNGTADDTAPINAAIAAGIATGTTVYFPKGTYKVTSPIVISTNKVELLGAGASQTILQYAGGVSAYAFKVGTSAPLTTQIQGVRWEDMTLKGSANTSDVLFVAGVFRSYFSRLDLRDATVSGLHTQWAVVNTFLDIHVTALDWQGAFIVQPVVGLWFDQIDASHQTTASTVVDPIVEGVSGSGIKFTGASNMTVTSGTSEWNNRGIEFAAGSSSTQNVVIGIDLEQNTVEDLLIGTAANSFVGILSAGLTHVTNQGNVFVGGFYKDVTIDTGSLGNSFDISYNGGTFTDNGLDTKVIRLLNTGAVRLDQVPWTSRDTIPAVAYSGIWTPDKQDTLTGDYSIVGTTQTLLSNTVYGATIWRVIFLGTWSNNTEGGGLAQVAPYIEATSAAPTIAIGTVTVTVSKNGSGQFQLVTGNAAHRVGFSGRIYVAAYASGAAGLASLAVKGSLVATSLDMPTLANLNIGATQASSVSIGRDGWSVAINASISYARRRTVADAATTADSVSGADYTIAYTSITATRIVTLPAANTGTGRVLILKDESGSASATVKIQGTAAGSDKLDGVTAGTPKDLIIAAYGAARLYSSGANWFTF